MMGVPKGNRPTILTFHDIGLNHKTCFESLFNHKDMHEIMQHFAVCHVDAPGQQEGASTLSTEYTYPSMDQLSETLPMVLQHFRNVSFAQITIFFCMCLLKLKHPDMVEGLVLINLSAHAEGFLERAAQKITSWTHAIPDTVISHLLIFPSFLSRRNLEIERPVQGGNLNARMLQCPALLIVGDNSPVVDAVVDSNSRMNPTTTTFLKMADCGGLPQVDQPGKLIEAFKYFIQGMGYMPSASMTRLARSRTASNSSMERNRNRSGTNTDEQRGRSHTDVSMESTPGAEHGSSGPTHSVELSC
uniref:N-myc downstream regulated 1 n=1 Tax=Cyprinus carpio TaxID=7962 RepID=A0A8C2AFV0_CYPCA